MMLTKQKRVSIYHEHQFRIEHDFQQTVGLEKHHQNRGLNSYSPHELLQAQKKPIGAKKGKKFEARKEWEEFANNCSSPHEIRTLSDSTKHFLTVTCIRPASLVSANSNSVIQHFFFNFIKKVQRQHIFFSYCTMYGCQIAT